MSNEVFEKALSSYAAEHVTGSVGLVRKIGRHFYDARQPEIDALKEEISLCHGTLESRERNIETLAEVNVRLKAEVKWLNSALMRDAISDLHNVERVDVFPVYSNDEKLRKAAEDVLETLLRVWIDTTGCVLSMEEKGKVNALRIELDKAQ